jgi:DNA-binding MarR family transcriptional regulator
LIVKIFAVWPTSVGETRSRGDDDYSRTRKIWNGAAENQPALTGADRPNVLWCHMTEPTPEQVARLTRAFEQFTRRFKVAEAAAAADNALNALDAQTLVFVGENPGCGIGDVARYLNVAMTTMSSAIDRLVRKDLIERGRPEDDRRSAVLTATDKGRQAIEDHIAAYREACRRMLRSLDPREQRELIRLTEKIARSGA